MIGVICDVVIVGFLLMEIGVDVVREEIVVFGVGI